MAVEVRHLRALVAVIDTGSFTQGAATLGLSQAAVSRAVADLERTVGQRLLGAGTLVLGTTGEQGGLVVRDVPRVRWVARLVTDLVEQADPAQA